MSIFSKRVTVPLLTFCAALFVLSVIFVPWRSEAGQEKSEPWSSAEVLQPEDLLGQLKNKTAESPTIIYVGFRTLFEGGHIPGAKFYGTASTEKGLADLKSSLATLPRSAELVIYCGCCPFVKCPNIRPAYKALHDMGFTKIRVLVLPTSFAADWVEKGYPIEKGLP
jgi:thiosulfate/3-mercaptopyruvate sulfurtransferase